eukprot:GHRR01037575.1.p1 GENE.GHRR01037575.1~~GHRR01037575.1.p1  ORF type:complete len:175 (-),score=47.97 GHRR01037575.1:356-832(-)
MNADFPVYTGVLFYFFKPAGAGSCSLNVFLITASLLLCVAFSMLSLLPMARNGSLFPSSTTALYIMYLCYSALQSEPRDYECNGLGHRLNAASGSTLVIGMLVTLLSVVYSALRAGKLGTGVQHHNARVLQSCQHVLIVATVVKASVGAGPVCCLLLA